MKSNVGNPYVQENVKMYVITLLDIPTLRTYKDALEHYESIKPIRGKPWLRPIIKTPNGRRRKHMRIIKYRDGTIGCILYDTTVLTYLPNGEIHFKNGGYASPTTHQFVTAILGHGHMTFHRHNNQTCVTSYFSPYGEKSVLVNGHNRVKFKWDADAHRYDFIDPPKMYGYYLKRAPMGIRRKEIEPFTKYVLALAKLVDPAAYMKRPAVNYRRRSANWLYQKVTGDADAQAEAVEFLLHRTCMYRTGLLPSSKAGGYLVPKPTILPKDISNILNDMLKYVYFNDLFEKREVDKINSNGNDRYMKGGNTSL